MHQLIFTGLLIAIGVTAGSETVDSICPPDLLNKIDSQYLQVWNDSCFHFVIYKSKTYGDASKNCMQDGGMLALPKSKELNDYLTNQLKNYSSSEKAWIGLHYKKGGTEFIWEDNNELEWDNFASGKGPDNDWLMENEEYCVSIDPYGDGLWYDHRCDSTKQAHSVKSNPKNGFICQYTPVEKDALDIDEEEVLKVTAGSETVDSICPPDLLNKIDSQYLQVWNGSCFHFVTYRSKTYSDASKDCMQDGGMLALSKSKELNNYLTNQLKNYSRSEKAWIGLHYEKGGTEFIWEDNNELEWDNFASGKGPYNDWLMENEEYCVSIDPYGDGLWYDQRCDSTKHAHSVKSNPKNGFICQYTPVEKDALDIDEEEVLKDDPENIEEICPPSLRKKVVCRFLQVQDGSCFHFALLRRKTYFDANKECKRDGGTLALAKTKSTNAYLTDQISNYYKTSTEVWIGLHDEKLKAEFLWEDKSKLSWNNFAKGNGPHKNWIGGGVENCVAMSPADGQWYHYQCDSELQSLATGSNPKKHYVCQYKPIEKDTLQVDGKDLRPHTTQSMAQTVVSSCPSSLVTDTDYRFFQVLDGSCFYFVLYKLKTYEEARTDCRKHGGTLALPKTKLLNDFLTQWLRDRNERFRETWIGLHDREEETQFIWEDNTKLGWSNFAEGNGPDNDWLARGVEDCVALDPSQYGLWHDHQCDSNLLSWVTRAAPRKPYICQYTNSA